MNKERLLSALKSVGLGLLDILVKIGLFFWDFLKRVGNLFASFEKFVINAIKGPDFGLYDKKKKEKDPNMFVFFISLVFALILWMLVRGYDVALTDFSSFFNLWILLPLGIGLVLASFFGLAITKRGYVCVKECVFSFLFPFFVAFLVHEAKSFGISAEEKTSNWFIYLAMSIPFYITVFSASLFTLRGFFKVFFGRGSEERKEDQKRRYQLLAKFYRRVGNYFKHNWGQILIVIALIALAVSVLLPLLVLLMRSVKFSKDDIVDPYAIPTRVTFDHYSYMWNYLSDAYFNSLVTTIGVTLGTVVLSSIAAFAFIRFKWPLKNVFFYAIIGLMMIPGILTLITRYQLVTKVGLLGNLWGIILPGIAGYIPMGFMLLYTFFTGIPKELFEAADVDGASDMKAFLKITVPLSKPILSTIAIQTFVGEWNDYLWASLIIGSDDTLYTLPVYLKRISDTYVSQNLAMSAPFAGYVLSAIPLVLIFIVASKQFIEGLTSGAFKM